MPSEFKVYKDYYLKDKVKYTRVTSVLDYFQAPGLVDWKLDNDDYKEIGKTAKSIGTRVHNLIQLDYEKGKYRLTPNDSVSIVNCMKAYEEWKKVEKPKIMVMEKTLFNEELRIAGTMDIELPGIIVDIKTSASIKPTYWLQVAMYNYLNNTLYDLAILRLDKFTGDYQYIVKPYDKRLVNIYLCLLNYYRYIIGNEDSDIDNLDLSDTIEVNPFDSLLIQ